MNGLVEWPVVLLGRIDAALDGLPPEVLITSMRAHQKYLALQDEAGALAPRFIIGRQQRDRATAAPPTVAGNERVLRARLWDARFFWEQDLKVRLEDRVEELHKIVFHAELGTVRERVAVLWL